MQHILQRCIYVDLGRSWSITSLATLRLARSTFASCRAHFLLRFFLMASHMGTVDPGIDAQEFQRFLQLRQTHPELFDVPQQTGTPGQPQNATTATVFTASQMQHVPFGTLDRTLPSSLSDRSTVNDDDSNTFFSPRAGYRMPGPPLPLPVYTLPPPRNLSLTRLQTPDPQQAAGHRRLRATEPAIDESSAQLISGVRPKRARTTSVAVSPSTQSVSEASSGSAAGVPFTPYRRPENHRAVQQYSPPSKNIIRTGETNYGLWIATKAGFPPTDKAEVHLDQIFANQCAAVGGDKKKSRLERYRSVKLYRNDARYLMRRAGSHIRNHIIKFIRSKDFGCGGFKTAEENAKHSKELIRSQDDEFRASYHFGRILREGDRPDGKIIKRIGAYRHPLIGQTIAEVFFLNNEQLGVDFPDDFNPMPLATIALVATAMDCAVKEWSNGYRQMQEFSFALFGSVYAAHLEELKKYDEDPRNEEASALWRCALYKQCISKVKPSDGDAPCPVQVSPSEFQWDDDPLLPCA